LDKFPIPSEHLSLEDRYGVYCCGDMWPDGGVFIIKRGSSFKPTMRKLTKTITVHEYASTPKRVRKPAAKKAVTKKNGSAK
jgi:hypothetical protein